MSGCSSLLDDSERDGAGPESEGPAEGSDVPSGSTDGTDATDPANARQGTGGESGSRFDKLVPDDGDPQDVFGSVVAAAGDAVVVGAPGDEDPNGDRSGSAYVFRYSDGAWAQEAKLHGPEDEPTNLAGDAFGTTLSLSESSVVVGAPFNKVIPEENDADVTALNGGTVYAFDRSGLELNEQVIARDESKGDAFGGAVSVSGDRMLVGAPLKHDTPMDSGLDNEPGGAYLFERTDGTWTETSQFAIEDTGVYNLGRRVELAGDRAFVGARRETSARSNPGELFAFVRSDGRWERDPLPTPDEGDTTRDFARDIAAAGDTVLVGARGVAHVFQRSDGSWSHEAELSPSERSTASGDFGAGVALTDDGAVVGDPGGSENGEAAGAVYKFERSEDGWVERRKYLAPDGDSGDEFGGDVATGSGLIAAGARKDEDPNRERSGSAYVSGRETTVAEATETSGSSSTTERPNSTAEMTWPTFQYDAANSGATDATASVEGNEKWRFDFLSSSEASPVVGNGTVYAGSEDGKLYALSPDDGSIEWEYQENDSIDRERKQPAVVGDTVYVSSRYALAVNADDGSEKWRSEVSADGAPNVVDGTVYVSNTFGVVALDAGNGATRWEAETDRFPVSSPAVDSKSVYIGDSDGIVYAFAASDGSEQWRFQTDSEIEAPPAVVDDTVYVGTTAGVLYALDASDGSEQWRFQTDGEIHTSPAVVDGSVYATVALVTYSVAAENGEKEWESRAAGSLDSSPVIADGTLYVGSFHKLRALDLTDGTERWSFSAEEDVVSPPAVGEDAVYFTTRGRHLFALE